MDGRSYTASLKGGGPWGFRLQGGKDFGSPLSISKVTPGSKGDIAGISSGDYVLKINGDSSDDMTHFDAQDAIRRAGMNLELVLEKKHGTKTMVVTETVHSAKVDHKYNAMAKPFGASTPPSQPRHLSQPQAPVTGHTSPAGGTSWQPPSRQPQPAPSVWTGPAGAGPAPPPPPPPLVPASRGPYDQTDTSAHRPHYDDARLAENFKLNISDDGDVGFLDEPPTYGHPPDPRIQSKSFKRLQKHLEHSEEDDLPPPPPEAFNDPEDDDDKHIQSRTFKMLQDAVEAGETAPSVFSRPKDDRSKSSTTPIPKMYRPSPPVIKPAHDRPQAPPAPVMTRPGQPQPVALPGMVQMAEPASSQPVRSPSQKLPTAASPAAVSPSSPPGQPEWKRTPTKPPAAQPIEETRTPFCDACGKEILGPFVSAIGKAWHPDHFVCDGCGDSLQNQGFIEEGGKLYCEKDFNKYFAPHCESCKQPIVGPKSLHSCPKAVPPPSSAMLRAIRESSMKGNVSAQTVKSKPQHLNTALTLRKDSQEIPTKTSSYTSPEYGVFFPQQNGPRDNSNNWPSSSGISNVTSVSFIKPHSEPGVGSLKEKVVALKKAIRKEEARGVKAKQGVPLAVNRFRDAKMLLSKLERKRIIAEDKVEKLEERIRYQKSRLDAKHREMSELWTSKCRMERKETDELRNIKNIEYEITEMRAAKESSMQRVRGAAHRASNLQSAVENAADRCRELSARKRTLQDMIEMYSRRTKDLRAIARERTIQAEKKILKINLLEDSISDSVERFKQAEKRLLPLKIYICQLQESLDQTRNETRNVRYYLTKFQGSLRGHSFTYYPFKKQ